MVLAIAFLMAFLVFPNPLRVPTNNPTATAEIAPVPGPPQQEQPQANFSETQLATSAGVGAGGLGAGAGLPPPVLPPKEVPVQKDCVRDPITGVVRQTEDPLSPPCVPFWDASNGNGGATWRGVTGDEIKVVLYNDQGLDIDMTKPYKPTDENESVCSADSRYECENIVRTIKAQLKYFQKRFQTYGRRVRVIAQPSSGGVTTTPEIRRQDAVISYQTHRPFAAVYLGNEADAFFEKAASLGILTFGLNEDVRRGFYERYPGFIWSFFPDQETQQQWSASFICNKLAGREARFAFQDDLRDRTRKFGFIYGLNSQRGTGMERMAGLLIRNVKQMCGLEFVEATYDASDNGTGGAEEAPQIIARMKLANVTTLICYCIPVPSELTVTKMRHAASAAEYYPEWYWDSVSRMDKPVWQETYAKGDERQRSFGSSYYWRAPAFEEHYHYQAYLQEAPGTVPNVRFNFNIYHLFLNLFTGIQAAGPRVTPDSIQKGMFTFKWSRQDYPWVPTGGYGPDGPGTYTFDDTAMMWWWDPTGTPPGEERAKGCIRVGNEGRRFYWNQWPKGDVDLFGANDPCTVGPQKILNPTAADF